ncbi:MAG: polysaccharide deacetylase family protein [Chitinivibrionales bacterium]|nr:polysaccharide deacetylase family protein [Chitinivibrionales bacterium]
MSEAKTQKTLLISVDLDLWYHCRWASGGPHSRWPSAEAALQSFYGDKNPPQLKRDFTGLVETILEIFDRFSLKATFFILGEMARRHPDAVKKIFRAGHEIASHGYNHVDAADLNEAELHDSVADSKKILEDCCGCAVSGFRFPNLVYSKREFDMLQSQGYTYDSSVCFSRKLFGKFGSLAPPLNNPYHPDVADPFRTGASGFWEIPIPVFPFLRLPAGSGIATRLMGKTWSALALNRALKTGPALYYFHPFDLHYVKGLAKTSINARLFLRNTGEPFRRSLLSLLQTYSKKVRCTCVRDWLPKNS